MKAALLRYLMTAAGASALAVFIAQSEAIAAAAVQTTPATVATGNAIWRDASRKRDVPVKWIAPARMAVDTPLIIFSHGLGGSVEAGRLWGEHWARHGYLVLHLQHAGSDEAIWKDKPQGQRLKGMKQAMTAKNLALRSEDVRFVLDEVERRHRAQEQPWRSADLKRIGMSGHSFGARTTMAVAGQKITLLPNLTQPDARVTAAIAFSPVASKRAGGLDAQFANIRMPLMSLTGSKDSSVLVEDTQPEDRTLPFEHMPGPGQYLVWFDGADHMVFGGQALRRAATPRDAEIQEDVKAITLAFWDAYLKQDAKALGWLRDSAPGILATNDKLRMK